MPHAQLKNLAQVINDELHAKMLNKYKVLAVYKLSSTVKCQNCWDGRSDPGFNMRSIISCIKEIVKA